MGPKSFSPPERPSQWAFKFCILHASRVMTTFPEINCQNASVDAKCGSFEQRVKNQEAFGFSRIKNYYFKENKYSFF